MANIVDIKLNVSKCVCLHNAQQDDDDLGLSYYTMRYGLLS